MPKYSQKTHRSIQFTTKELIDLVRSHSPHPFPPLSYEVTVFVEDPSSEEEPVFLELESTIKFSWVTD